MVEWPAVKSRRRKKEKERDQFFHVLPYSLLSGTKICCLYLVVMHTPDLPPHPLTPNTHTHTHTHISDKTFNQASNSLSAISVFLESSDRKGVSSKF